MNNIGKTLAGMSTFFSILFLGFVFAACIGGTNWEGEAASLENYVVEPTTSDKKEVTYTVKNKATGETVKGTSKILPDVIIAAHNHEAGQLKEKIDALELQHQPLPTRLVEIQQHQKIDRKAMETREQQLAEEFESLSNKVQELSVEGDKTSQEALTTWNEGELRREDVARLRNHLEELDVDAFQLKEQKKRLQDELSRLQGVLARLQRRNVQLQAKTPAAN